MFAVQSQCRVAMLSTARRFSRVWVIYQNQFLLTTARQAQNSCPLSYCCHQSRGAKTVTRRKLKDLQQGAIVNAPLPVADNEDGPQYPAVLLGVKNNMIKFDKCVILTRVGNFYELYFEHAEEYGPLLGLKVASRKTLLGPVAMAGFPFFQLERFLKILVEDLNKFVAISEEFSKNKSGGPPFDRKVTRVITPGTLIDEKFLNPLQNNFLLAVHIDDHDLDVQHSDSTSTGEIGLAWLDLSTGDFFTQVTSRTLLSSVLPRINAREILLPPNAPQVFHHEIELVLSDARELITSHEPSSEFSDMSEWNSMLESPITSELECIFTVQEKLAGHTLLDYVRTRLQGSSGWLRHPQRRQELEFLGIDRSSLRGLEILETSRDGFGKGSLFHAVRRTVTNSGARLLRDRLASPSASLSEIQLRLDLVTNFFNNDLLREQIISHLRNTHDVKRLVQKFALNKGDADDLLALAKAIAETAKVCQLLEAFQQDQKSSGMPDGTTHLPTGPIDALLRRMSLAAPAQLAQRILSAIDEESLNQKHQLEDDEATEVAVMVQQAVKHTAPEELAELPRNVQTRTKSATKTPVDDVEDVWIFRREASSVLNRLHKDRCSLQEEKAALQDRLRREIVSATLTLKWTPGLGHICHIRSATGFKQDVLDTKHARMVSSSKSTRSFYLPEWTKLGGRMDQITTSIRGEEQRLFNELRDHVIQNLVSLRRNSTVMDELDVATSFALLALEQNWTRPLLNEGLSHNIVGGRHPTVKLGLEERGRSFVSNDLLLGEHERIWIITGPNMAGKSTFLRQNALITILAQVGSYVPADHADIGIVDQIFSRIGAADDLFRDQSTFMVEMLETAAILRHATPRSFVIVDEVGRGTTPEDGTAVAFASLHHLYHHNRCRTLFATHFHSLHDMTKNWEHIGRYCTDLMEDQRGSFSFLHKLKPGINRRSHALTIAGMAGLPSSAIEVARQVLQESKHHYDG